jgi:hypothetical protein
MAEMGREPASPRFGGWDEFYLLSEARHIVLANCSGEFCEKRTGLERAWPSHPVFHMEHLVSNQCPYPISALAPTHIIKLHMIAATSLASFLHCPDMGACAMM